MAELGRLTAVFDADTHKFDAGAKGVESKVTSLSGVFRALGATTTSLQGPLNGISGRINAVGTLFRMASADVGAVGTAATSTGASIAAMAGPIGLAVAAVAGLTVGLGLLGKAIFDLANSTAEYEGKLFDLSKQTNFSVETLSALTLAAKTSGGSIDSVASSLAIFQSNMVKAAEGNKEYAKTFRDLKIDTEDQEKALRQAMASLFAMGATEKQSAEAKKLFGKAAKDVIGLLKETNGNIDGAIERYKSLNLLVSTEAAIAADAYSDSLEELTEQFAAMGRVIGNAAIPVLNTFFNDMTSGLAQSQGAFASWSDFIEHGIARLLGLVGALGQAFRQMSIAGWAAVPGNAIARGDDLFARAKQQQAGLMGFSAADSAAAGAQRRTGGGGGVGGGRGGGVKTDPSVAYMERLNAELAKLSDSYTGVDTATKLYAVTQEIANGALKKAIPATQEAARIKARDFDRITLQVQALKELTDFQKDQNEAVRQALFGNKSYFVGVNEIIASQQKLGEILDDSTIFWLNHKAAILANKDAMEMYAHTLEAIMLPGAAGEGLGEDEIARRSGAAANAAVGIAPENIHQKMVDIHNQMMGLGQDLTSIFSDSIGDGFDKGVKRGLQTLALGLLDIVQNIFLKKIAEGLGNILSDMMGGGGKSFLGGLGDAVVGAVLGGAAGGVGGGGGGTGGKGGLTGGFAGKFAAGGFIGPGQWGIAGEKGPERIYGGQTGMSVLPGGGQTVHNHYSINLPPTPKGSVQSRKSQRQQAEQIIAALQGAQ